MTNPTKPHAVERPWLPALALGGPFCYAFALVAARRMLTRGFVDLAGGRQGNVLTFTPPLTIEDAALEALA